ncbi:hypothetical protein D039_4762A, partial [Vibrio parahaemolyticus EKP-028]
MLIRGFK